MDFLRSLASFRALPSVGLRPPSVPDHTDLSNMAACSIKASEGQNLLEVRSHYFMEPNYGRDTLQCCQYFISEEKLNIEKKEITEGHDYQEAACLMHR